ncbi:MAG: putative porin [Phocaeicola sp.]
MKKIVLLLLILFATTQANVFAQNTINPMGSSASGLDQGKYDRNGNPIDTTAVVDSKTIPIGLYSWKIDNYFGNINSIPVDTLQLGFQNSNDTGGNTGQYNYLGNLGSPRLSRLYFDRRDASQFIFSDLYDFTVLRPQDVIFTNTLSPYTNLSYFTAGSSRYAEERFKAYFAVNANKRLGVGFYADYVYGRGQYSDQSTALFNGGLFASYRGDQYQLHAVFNTDNLKMAENGGLADDRYITDPVGIADGGNEYKTYDMPTRLTQVWNHSTSYHGFVTHRYNLGFHREREDSTSVADSIITLREFVPVTSFIHTLEIDANQRKYISYNTTQNNEKFLHNYLGNDSIDATKRTSIKNTFGISLMEGFNKYAKAGLTAFIRHEYRDFALVDTVAGSSLRQLNHYKENVVSVGGELAKREGKTFHYSVLGEVAILGEDLGQFSIEAKSDLNFKLFGDTVRFEANGFIKNQNPIFYHRKFHSKHHWWDNDELEKTFRTRVEGKLAIDKWGTNLRAGIENVSNYTYLANTGVVTPTTDGTPAAIKYAAAVEQNSGSIQVFSAIWQQKLRAGIFHLETEVAYQKSSNQQVLPLPELSAYGNLFLRAGLSKKVLTLELGADVRYFSKYYAPDYLPSLGQFYLQNPDDLVEIGGYPIVNVYANLHLKRTRFFVMMYHINSGSGSRASFLTPHYALNPSLFKIGLSWNFFD